MGEVYTEKEMALADFRAAIGRIEKSLIEGLLESFLYYTDHKCSYEGSVIECDSFRIEVGLEFQESSPYGAELKLSYSDSAEGRGDIGLTFAYDPELKVHKFIFLTEKTNLKHLQEHIYYYPYSRPHFLLKILNREELCSVLSRELFLQLAHLLDPLMLKEEIKFTPEIIDDKMFRMSADALFDNGFTINQGRVYSLHDKKIRLPESALPLFVKRRTEAEIFARYDDESEEFYRIDNHKKIEAVELWRYAENAIMKWELSVYWLNSYKEHIIHGENLAPLSTPPSSFKRTDYTPTPCYTGPSD